MKRLYNTLKLIVAAALVAGLTLPTTASAVEPPEQSVYLGVYGGGNLVTGDWDVSDAQNNPVDAGSSAMTSFRLGGHVNNWLALEGSIGLLPNITVGDERNTMLKYDADVVFNLMKTRVRPYVLTGAGIYQHIDGDNDSDFDYNAHYGAGMDAQLTRWLGLRVEARHILTDGRGDSDVNIASNVEIHAGLNFFAFRDEDGGYADSDKDGVIDSDDDCVEVAGSATAQGCPDADEDTIADKFDACPNIKGLVGTAGCPDSDKDGVINSLDECALSPGLPELNGCLDTDKDAIVDSKDTCPEKAGSALHAGCPDTDKDGVADRDDACPLEAGPAYGVACPEQPKDVVYTFIGSIEGVHFAYDKAEIRPDSSTVLDTTAKAIRLAVDANPNLRMEIQGHTDDEGDDTYNHELSHKRAEAVRAALISRGVPAMTLKATGYGETRPTASNETDDGRALNRRVEIRILAR